MRALRLQLLFPLCASASPLVFGGEQQQPLSSSASKAHFTVREQDDTLCHSGARQWTGTVNVTDERSMFFWYHESRNDPETDPVILWMSGGPGATGSFGMFKELGPCIVNADANSTRPRESSWTNRANVLFIDQPIGIGFSALANRSAAATSLAAGARDLHAFLSVLTADVFPQLAGKRWHFAGESFGGRWTTAYAAHVLAHQQEPGLRIASVVAVDGSVDLAYSSVGLYGFFCANGGAPLMNETACGAMGAGVAECEDAGRRCREVCEGGVCEEADKRCREGVGRYFWEGVRPGGWNPYDSRMDCTEPPLCSDLNGGPAAAYLNQAWVQERLGFWNVSFELIDFDLNERWTESKNAYVPTTRELTWLLDNTHVRILFINGNNDIIVNTPGQLRLLNEQPWKGQTWFQNQPLQEWYHRKGEVRGRRGNQGGRWKGSSRLSIFTVDEAGHMAPDDQPEAVEALVGSWISDEWHKRWFDGGKH